MSTVRLKKTERFINGTIQERVIVIKESVWNRIRVNVPSHLKYEVLSNSPIVNEKQLMPTSQVVAEAVDYSNYSLEDLKEAARNAGIKGYAVLGKAKLIEKLNTNDNSGTN